MPKYNSIITYNIIKYVCDIQYSNLSNFFASMPKYNSIITYNIIKYVCDIQYSNLSKFFCNMFIFVLYLILFL